MSKQDDIKVIIEQEKALVFPEFDEAIAFKIGSWIRDVAISKGQGIVAEVRTWERPMFYMSLPGTTGDNPHWVRRKANLVQRVAKSSYRVVLERSWPEEYFLPRSGLDNMDVVLAGGGFPVRVKGAGLIGAITVSGLPERGDHELVVQAICTHLKLEYASLALPTV